jgi:hypothetical protein
MSWRPAWATKTNHVSKTHTKKKKKKKRNHGGMVAHTCNPSYPRGGDQEDHIFRLAQAKIYQEHISINKLGIVICAFDPSYVGITGKRNII